MPLTMDKLAIFAADVGAGKNFGWACERKGERETGESLGGLAKSALGAVRNGLHLAVGFECPLFIPCPVEAIDLGKQREGEKGRPWSAAAGPTVAMHGIQQLCWMLRYVLTSLEGRKLGTVDWEEFLRGDHKLFLWEAFVSGKAKTGSHTGDALASVDSFKAALPDPTSANAVNCAEPISLGGLALMWSGWSRDPRVLHRPILTLKL